MDSWQREHQLQGLYVVVAVLWHLFLKGPAAEFQAA